MPGKKIFTVIDGPLSVRAEPGGQWLKQYPTGTEVECKADSRTESGGYVWWEHGEGWSAERSLNDKDVFLKAVAEKDADAGSMADFAAKEPEKEAEFVTLAADGDVRIRSAPTLNGDFIRWLKNGEAVRVDLSTRTEADGFVWVKHGEGWSAERTLDKRETYLKDLAATREVKQVDDKQADSDAMESFAEPPAKAPETDIIEFQAGVDVRVRSEPSLTGAHLKWIPRGTTIEVNQASETKADGYIWLKHDEGWSAWKSTDESDVFLVKPGSVPPAPKMTETGPDVTTLPGYKTLIKRLPVDLEQTAWWQYFGNNVYAVQHGKSWGYDRYAQGLHSGLDFGNNAAGIPAYAGLEATFVKHDRYGIWGKSGDYTIIWQHLCNVPDFGPGTQFTPDTKLGELDPSSQRLRHLHFEIRYRGTWIINPLLFMPDEMVNAITDKFNPKRPGNTSELYYFYKDSSWNQWITPLDQPVIKLGGKVIGPTAR